MVTNALLEYEKIIYVFLSFFDFKEVPTFI